MTQDQSTVTTLSEDGTNNNRNESLSEEAYKELLTQELEKKGSGGKFVW